MSAALTRTASHDDGLRILMLSTDFGQKGGISTVVSAWRDAGLLDEWAVRFIPTHRSDLTLPARVALAAKAIGCLSAELWRGRVQAVHIHTASYGSFWRKFPLCVITLMARRPLVLHVHGGAFADFHRHARPWQRAAINLCLRRASCVIALSPTWASRLGAVAKRDVAWVCNPAPQPPASDSELSREPRIVFLGRLTREKGVHDLLCAFAALAQTHPQAQLDLCGEGPTEALSTLARTLGVAERVHLHGWVDGERKSALLRRASLLALPSYVEGLPLCVLEAMAHDLPVVATAVGGIPDLIVDGVSGRLVPAGDTQALAAAISALLDDPSLARRMSEQAHLALSHQFSTVAVAEQLRAIYRSIGLVPTESKHPNAKRTTSRPDRTSR